MPRNTELDPPAGSFGAGLRWMLWIAGLLVVLTIVGVLAGFVTSPFRFASGVANRTFNPDNAISSYERFHDLHRGFDSRVRQVRETGALWAEERDPAERGRLGIELRAQKQSCREIANTFNADATKTNRDVFRGQSLPERLDPETCG